MNENEKRRLINLGELIALAALVVSAIGVWIAWKSSGNDQPTKVVEQRQAIPLTLRGKADRDGRALEISPVEASHALESLTLTITGASPIQLGSDGDLPAGDIEAALKDRDKDTKGSRSIPVRIDARYVELGKERRTSGNYVLRYRWEGGGLLGGRSLRLTGLSRG
jgi:hypothetical protein